MKVKSLLFAVLCLVISFSYGQDFEVSPVVLNFSLEPGEVASKTITITNYSAKEYTFVLEQYDEGYNGEEIERYMPPGTSSNSIAEWLSVNPTLIKILPNQSKTADVILSVPSNDNSTKWGAIGVRTAEERSEYDADKTLGTGLLVSPRIKVTIMQSPKSNKDYRGKIIAMEPLADSESGFKRFEVIFKNEGSKKIKPEVYLMSANMITGQERKEVKSELTLMPGQSKKMILTINSQLAPGDYAVATVMDYGGHAPIEVFQVSLVLE